MTSVQSLQLTLATLTVKRRRTAGPPSFALRGGAREFTAADEAAHTAAQHAVDALLQLRALPRPALTQRAAAATLEDAHSAAFGGADGWGTSRRPRWAARRHGGGKGTVAGGHQRPRRRRSPPSEHRDASPLEDLQELAPVEAEAAQELEDLRRGGGDFSAGVNSCLIYINRGV